MNPVEVFLVIMTCLSILTIIAVKTPKFIKWMDNRHLLIEAKQNAKLLLEEEKRRCACGCGELCGIADVFDRQWWLREHYRKLIG